MTHWHCDAEASYDGRKGLKANVNLTPMPFMAQSYPQGPSPLTGRENEDGVLMPSPGFPRGGPSSSNLTAVSLQYCPRLVYILVNLLQESFHCIVLQFFSKSLHVFQPHFLVI